MADGVAPADVYKVLGDQGRVSIGRSRSWTRSNRSIQWWEAGAQPPQLLAAGDVVMSSAYNGRIATAQKEAKTNLKIVWDRQHLRRSSPTGHSEGGTAKKRGGLQSSWPSLVKPENPGGLLR